MYKTLILLIFAGLWSCKPSVPTVKCETGPLTESVYASGTVKSEGQYQAFIPASGIIQKIFVTEGDSVKKGQELLSLVNETQKLNRENALLAAEYASVDANQGKLRSSELSVALLRSKLSTDSALYARQLALWQQNIGTRVELEQRQLAYQASRQNYDAATIAYADLKRQISFAARQSEKNFFISERVENDLVLRSELDGVVYSLLRKEGEIVSPQTPLAVIGSASVFVLEMGVDEYDITRIKVGQKALVTMDSYKDQVFEARITRIYPFMNQQAKSFLVEAKFIHAPQKLYPNISFEANIILQRKDKALTVPREYTIGDSLVINTKGDTLRIVTGLKDYHTIEVLKGLSGGDEIRKPQP